MRRRVALLLALFTVTPLLGAAVEVYGRPLRGLSAVSLTEITGHPERYRDRAIRVAGEVAGAAGPRLVLSEGGASLPVESDGSFSLPSLAKGAKVTTEGKLRSGTLVLAATGLEVRR